MNTNKTAKRISAVLLAVWLLFSQSMLSLAAAPAVSGSAPAVTAIAYAPNKWDATASVPIPDRADEAAYIIGQSKVFWRANDDDISPEAKNLFYVEFSNAMGNRYYLFDVQFDGSVAHYGLLSGNTHSNWQCAYWQMGDDSQIDLYSADGAAWDSYHNQYTGWPSGGTVTLRVYASSDKITADNAGNLTAANLIAAQTLDLGDGALPHRAYPSTEIQVESPASITSRTQSCRRLTAASQGQPSCYEELTVNANGQSAVKLHFTKNNDAAECKVYFADTFYPYRVTQTTTPTSGTVSVALTKSQWIAVRWFSTTNNADYDGDYTNQIGNTEYYYVTLRNVGSGTTPSTPSVPATPSTPPAPSEPEEPAKEEPEPVEETPAFTDVSTGAWYEDAVSFSVKAGLMTGVGSDRFDPDGTVTRAMMATVLYNASSRPEVEDSTTFNDVPKGKWYSKAIAWAQKNHLVAGYSDSTFGTNDPLTREQMATILWHFAGKPEAAETQAFVDSDSISIWEKDAVAWARENEIVNGVGNNRFDPKGTATRAQLAQVLMNSIENEMLSLSEES